MKGEIHPSYFILHTFLHGLASTVTLAIDRHSDFSGCYRRVDYVGQYAVDCWLVGAGGWLIGWLQRHVATVAAVCGCHRLVENHKKPPPLPTHSVRV